jgi:hypothetical protein
MQYLISRCAALDALHSAKPGTHYADKLLGELMRSSYAVIIVAASATFFFCSAAASDRARHAQPQGAGSTKASQYVVEPSSEAQAQPGALSLSISGLGPDRTVVPATITFELEGARRADLGSNSDAIIMTPSANILHLRDFWKFNPANGTFAIAQQDTTRLLDKLPPGQQIVLVNFVSDDGKFAVTYNLTLTVSPGAGHNPAKIAHTSPKTR